MQAFINAYQSAWRSAKLTYHLVALSALVLVVASIATGHMNGYYQLNLPLGTTINSVDASDVLPIAIAQNTIPMPAHKPRVPK